MTNKLPIVFVCAGLAIVAGAIFLGRQPEEPSFTGKPLSLWLLEYDLDKPAWGAADQAVAAMGTNAIPFLLKASIEHDPEWKRWLVSQVSSKKSQQRREKRAYMKQKEVQHAFFALRSRASEVVPMLVAMYNEPNWVYKENCRLEILSQLGNMGPLARESIPLLVRETASTNAHCRLEAFWALGMVHLEPESVVPILMRGLDSDDVRIRQVAASGLQQFGAQAQSAIPALARAEEEENKRAKTWPFSIDDRAAQGAEQLALTSISNASLSLTPSDKFSIANNNFGLRLYSELAKKDGNLFVSPISIEIGLAMLHSGANGDTAAQMTQVLGLEDENPNFRFELKSLLNGLKQTNDLGCQLALANSLWMQAGFPLKENFKRTVIDDFGAQFGEIDFAASPEKACDQINSWLKTQTHGRIAEVVAPSAVDSQTDLVLANAAYFKGRWTAGFDKEKTLLDSFKLDHTNSISVPIMSGLDKFGYAEGSDVRVLEMFYTDPAYFSDPQLPFNSNRFSMVILLPKNIEGLKTLEQSLTYEKINELLSQTVLTNVAVRLPKFTIKSGFDFKPTLQKMGMVDAFLENRADFSKISAEKPLFIDFVYHKSWLRVDESGTEAAATSLFGLTHGAPPRDVKVFNADHPFLFMIRDNYTGILLFLGRVVDPSR